MSREERIGQVYNELLDTVKMDDYKSVSGTGAILTYSAIANHSQLGMTASEAKNNPREAARRALAYNIATSMVSDYDRLSPIIGSNKAYNEIMSKSNTLVNEILGNDGEHKRTMAIRNFSTADADGDVYIRSLDGSRKYYSEITHNVNIGGSMAQWSTIALGNTIIGSIATKLLIEDSIEGKLNPLSKNFRQAALKEHFYTASVEDQMLGEMGRMSANVGAFVLPIGEQFLLAYLIGGATSATAVNTLRSTWLNARTALTALNVVKNTFGEYSMSTGFADEFKFGSKKMLTTLAAESLSHIISNGLSKAMVHSTPGFGDRTTLRQLLRAVEDTSSPGSGIGRMFHVAMMPMLNQGLETAYHTAIDYAVFNSINYASNGIGWGDAFHELTMQRYVFTKMHEIEKQRALEEGRDAKSFAETVTSSVWDAYRRRVVNNIGMNFARNVVIGKLSKTDPNAIAPILTKKWFKKNAREFSHLSQQNKKLFGIAKFTADITNTMYPGGLRGMDMALLAYNKDGVLSLRGTDPEVAAQLYSSMFISQELATNLMFRLFTGGANTAQDTFMSRAFAVSANNIHDIADILGGRSPLPYGVNIAARGAVNLAMLEDNIHLNRDNYDDFANTMGTYLRTHRGATEHNKALAKQSYEYLKRIHIGDNDDASREFSHRMKNIITSVLNVDLDKTLKDGDIQINDEMFGGLYNATKESLTFFGRDNTIDSINTLRTLYDNYQNSTLTQEEQSVFNGVMGRIKQQGIENPNTLFDLVASAQGLDPDIVRTLIGESAGVTAQRILASLPGTPESTTGDDYEIMNTTIRELRTSMVDLIINKLDIAKAVASNQSMKKEIRIQEAFQAQHEAITMMKLIGHRINGVQYDSILKRFKSVSTVLNGIDQQFETHLINRISSMYDIPSGDVKGLSDILSIMRVDRGNRSTIAAYIATADANERVLEDFVTISESVDNNFSRKLALRKANAISVVPVENAGTTIYINDEAIHTRELDLNRNIVTLILDDPDKSSALTTEMMRGYVGTYINKLADGLNVKETQAINDRLNSLLIGHNIRVDFTPNSGADNDEINIHMPDNLSVQEYKDILTTIANASIARLTSNEIDAHNSYREANTTDRILHVGAVTINNKTIPIDEGVKRIKQVHGAINVARMAIATGYDIDTSREIVGRYLALKGRSELRNDDLINYLLVHQYQENSIMRTLQVKFSSTDKAYLTALAAINKTGKVTQSESMMTISLEESKNMTEAQKESVTRLLNEQGFARLPASGTASMGGMFFKVTGDQSTDPKKIQAYTRAYRDLLINNTTIVNRDNLIAALAEIRGEYDRTYTAIGGLDEGGYNNLWNLFRQDLATRLGIFFTPGSEEIFNQFSIKSLFDLTLGVYRVRENGAMTVNTIDRDSYEKFTEHLTHVFATNGSEMLSITGMDARTVNKRPAEAAVYGAEQRELVNDFRNLNFTPAEYADVDNLLHSIFNNRNLSYSDRISDRDFATVWDDLKPIIQSRYSINIDDPTYAPAFRRMVNHWGDRGPAIEKGIDEVLHNFAKQIIPPYFMDADIIELAEGARTALETYSYPATGDANEPDPIKNIHETMADNINSILNNVNHMVLDNFGQTESSISGVDEIIGSTMLDIVIKASNSLPQNQQPPEVITFVRAAERMLKNIDKNPVANLQKLVKDSIETPDSVPFYQIIGAVIDAQNYYVEGSAPYNYIQSFIDQLNNAMTPANRLSPDKYGQRDEVFRSFSTKEVTPENFYKYIRRDEKSTPQSKEARLLATAAMDGLLVANPDYDAVKRVNAMFTDYIPDENFVQAMAREFSDLKIEYVEADTNRSIGPRHGDGSVKISPRMSARIGYMMGLPGHNATKISGISGLLGGLSKNSLEVDPQIDDNTIRIYTDNLKLANKQTLSIIRALRGRQYLGERIVINDVNHVGFTVDLSQHSDEIRQGVFRSLRLHAVAKQGALDRTAYPEQVVMNPFQVAGNPFDTESYINNVRETYTKGLIDPNTSMAEVINMTKAQADKPAIEGIYSIIGSEAFAQPIGRSNSLLFNFDDLPELNNVTMNSDTKMKGQIAVTIESLADSILMLNTKQEYATLLNQPENSHLVGLAANIVNLNNNFTPSEQEMRSIMDFLANEKVGLLIKLEGSELSNPNAKPIYMSVLSRTPSDSVTHLLALPIKEVLNKGNGRQIFIDSHAAWQKGSDYDGDQGMILQVNKKNLMGAVNKGLDTLMGADYVRPNSLLERISTYTEKIIQMKKADVMGNMLHASDPGPYTAQSDTLQLGATLIKSMFQTQAANSAMLARNTEYVTTQIMEDADEHGDPGLLELNKNIKQLYKTYSKNFKHTPLATHRYSTFKMVKGRELLIDKDTISSGLTPHMGFEDLGHSLGFQTFKLDSINESYMVALVDKSKNQIGVSLVSYALADSKSSAELLKKDVRETIRRDNRVPSYHTARNELKEFLKRGGNTKFSSNIIEDDIRLGSANNIFDQISSAFTSNPSAGLVKALLEIDSNKDNIITDVMSSQRELFLAGNFDTSAVWINNGKLEVTPSILTIPKRHAGDLGFGEDTEDRILKAIGDFQTQNLGEAMRLPIASVNESASNQVTVANTHHTAAKKMMSSIMKKFGAEYDDTLRDMKKINELIDRSGSTVTLEELKDISHMSSKYVKNREMLPPTFRAVLSIEAPDGQREGMASRPHELKRLGENFPEKLHTEYAKKFPQSIALYEMSKEFSVFHTNLENTQKIHDMFRNNFKDIRHDALSKVADVMKKSEILLNSNIQHFNGLVDYMSDILLSTDIGIGASVDRENISNLLTKMDINVSSKVMHNVLEVPERLIIAPNDAESVPVEQSYYLVDKNGKSISFDTLTRKMVEAMSDASETQKSLLRAVNMSLIRSLTHTSSQYAELNALSLTSSNINYLKSVLDNNGNYNEHGFNMFSQEEVNSKINYFNERSVLPLGVTQINKTIEC
ncbi:MAG: hypothetical protein M0Q41_10950 [Bacteroidales bacterium]|nr:hypothetical protein [Bacteroidales bacterium]